MGSKTDKKVNYDDYNEYPYQQVTSDDISKAGFGFFMRNNLPKSSIQDQCFLYNMDDKDKNGSHWTCVCIQYPDIFYFDPFSTELGGYPPQELRSWGKKYGFKKIIANEFPIQHIKSWLCGHYSLFMAEKLDSMIGKLTEQTFDDIIKKEFDIVPTDYNVDKITKWSKVHHLI